MKLVQYDDKYVIYLNNLYLGSVNLDNNTNITTYVKEVLMNLNDYYHIKLNGFYKVHVYINNNYGMIMDVNKISDYDDFGIDNIELKVIINNNSKMYISTDNYDVIKNFNCFYIKDNKYYLNIDNLSNFTKYSDFFDIIYKDFDTILLDAKMIRRN